MSWLLANVSAAIKVSSLYMKTGSPVSQQELNQMGSAKVFLIEKDGVQVIEKRNPTQIEVAFINAMPSSLTRLEYTYRA